MIMIAGQLGKVTGVSVDGDEFVDQVRSFVDGLDGVHWPTIALSVAVLVVLLASARVVPRCRAADRDTLATAVRRGFLTGPQRNSGDRRDPERVADAGVPGIGVADLSALVIPAAGIAIVAFSDNVLTARTFAARHGQQIDANAELRAWASATSEPACCTGFR